jgi:uncharacterized membrane protein
VRHGKTEIQVQGFWELPMAKTLSFGVMHITVAFSIVYLLTGSLVIGGLVALVEPIANTIAYHFHEKAWTRWRTRGPRPGCVSA